MAKEGGLFVLDCIASGTVCTKLALTPTLTLSLTG